MGLRSKRGQLGGTLQVYLALNRDAARAARKHQWEEAQELAHRASEIESSAAARSILNALRIELAGGAHQNAATPHAEWMQGDRDRLLASSRVWLRSDDLAPAALEVGRRIVEARRDVLNADEIDSVTAFLGTVSRLDDSRAEVESQNGDRWLVERSDLARLGLDSIGEPIAIFREELPSGPRLTFIEPALRAGARASGRRVDPFATHDLELGIADTQWFRDLERDAPFAVVTHPLPVRRRS